MSAKTHKYIVRNIFNFLTYANCDSELIKIERQVFLLIIKWVCNFEKTGPIMDKPKPRRPSSSRTDENVETIEP